MQTIADYPGEVKENLPPEVTVSTLWVFHGADDPITPASESRRRVEALKAAGGNVKHTKYDGVDHNCWDQAYAESELVPWLLDQR